MKKIHEANDKKLEEEKSKKYSSENLFKKKNTIMSSQTENEKSKEMSIEVYKESFIKKLIKKIKSFFKIL